MPFLFTALAFGAIGIVSFYVDKRNLSDPENAQENIKHSRQDLRFIAYLLALIAVLLGVIADRLPAH